MTNANSKFIFSGPAARNQSLEQVPFRALTFFYGLANHPEIERQLAPAGYTSQVHQEGWNLLHACSGFGGLDLATSMSPAATAIRELSTWYEHSFGRIKAALAHLHPDEEAFVFQGLAPVTGPAAVVAAELLLERLADLEHPGKNPARKGNATADKAAMATLASRGFDDKELNRIEAMVVAAHSVMPSEDPSTQGPSDPQETALLALKAWYDDWSATAHEVIVKRSDLIKIGLARPRKQKAAPVDPVTPPATSAGGSVSSGGTPGTPGAASTTPSGAPVGSPGAPVAQAGAAVGPPVSPVSQPATPGIPTSLSHA